MAWSKDTVVAAPKVVYTPGAGDAHPAVLRVIFDPLAAESEGYTAIMSGVHATNQSQSDFEAAIGVV